MPAETTTGLVQLLAERATDAVFLRRTSMTARGEKMLKSHVQEEIARVLSGFLGAVEPAALHGDRKSIPPTPEQVTLYSASVGYPLDGQKWCDFYEAKGWSVGRTRMKDWQAAVRNWRTNGWGRDGGIALNAPLSRRVNGSEPDYSKI